MYKPIRENMSRNLVIVSPGDSASAAYSKMQACKIRHLPVADTNGTVVGIVSDRDVLKAILAGPGTEVRDLMSFPVQTYDKNASLKTVAKKMVRDKISAVLVSDGPEIIGIATSEDLLKALVRLLEEPAEEDAVPIGTLDNIFSGLGASVGVA